MPKAAPTRAPQRRPRTWLEMRERIEKILEPRTGEGLDIWVARIRSS
jgi:hypothetical protein